MKVLERRDHTHADPRVRLRAVERSTDPDAMVEVACTDDSEAVRLAAVARLKDDLSLEKIARDAASLDVRLMAVERIFSQGVLADLLKSPENLELIAMCFSRITDRRLIESIAKDPEYSPIVRRMAIEYFADAGYLDEVAAVEAEEPEPRKSEERVEAFVELYGGGLRGVRAIGRFRRSEKALRALGTIARKGGETGGLAVEYLCSALASANPRLVECAAEELACLKDPDVVDCIIRALDDPKLTEPVRNVLKLIDTAEARAALGHHGRRVQ
jgi:HEAT repeat protein